jgi:hypothetical protein
VRIRHKIPSVFSLSMVDMLCCALGCVIMVWLLNAKVSEDEAEESRAETDQLRQQAQADRAESQRLLTSAKNEHDRATSRVRQLLSDTEKSSALLTELRLQLADREKSLAEDRERLAKMKKSLDEANLRVTKLEDKLAEEKKSSSSALIALQGQLSGEKKSRSDLEKTVALKESEIAALNKLIVEAKLLRERLEKLMADKDKTLNSALTKSKEETAAERARVKEKETTLAETLALLERLRKEQSVSLEQLKERLARTEKDREFLKTSLESRFAGITLKSRRAIFLIDASGSMEMLDSGTQAPDKWREVRNTVAKLLRSLPELEQFQLISFGEEVAYPLGGQGTWLTNDAKSPEQALSALAKVKPEGGTNMYAALKAAFAYRSSGLDTVYLLSDGLPNRGEGPEAEAAKKLTGVEKGERLGRQVRSMLSKEWNRKTADRPRVQIHTIGFFYESPDLGSFLWALARENEGSFVGMSTP